MNHSGSPDIALDRVLPDSIESERAVLGAILLDEKAILAAADVLTADDFYIEAHRKIFRCRAFRKPGKTLRSLFRNIDISFMRDIG